MSGVGRERVATAFSLQPLGRTIGTITASTALQSPHSHTSQSHCAPQPHLSSSPTNTEIIAPLLSGGAHLAHPRREAWTTRHHAGRPQSAGAASIGIAGRPPPSPPMDGTPTMRVPSARRHGLTPAAAHLTHCSTRSRVAPCRLHSGHGRPLQVSRAQLLAHSLSMMNCS